MNRQITPHKGGRTKELPRGRCTPLEREIIDQAISHNDQGVTDFLLKMAIWYLELNGLAPDGGGKPQRRKVMTVQMVIDRLESLKKAGILIAGSRQIYHESPQREAETKRKEQKR